MKPSARADDDRTPLGGLGEGAIHGLLGYQLAQAAIVTSRAFDRAVGKPMGLKRVEFTILQLAHQNPSASATNLAKALDITVPGVKLWLDRLAERKLIRRAPHELDGRSFKLEVTREGAKLLSAAVARLSDADLEILRDFSAGERQLLLELLHRLARLRAASDPA